MRARPAVLNIAWVSEGKSVLLVGGGKVGVTRVEKLLIANANVTVISPEVEPLIQTLASEKKLKWIKRNYRHDHSDLELTRWDMVLTAIPDGELSADIVIRSRELGLLVNAADINQYCDFYFEAQTTVGQLKVSVSTGGNSPGLAGRFVRDIGKFARENKVSEAMDRVGELRQKLRQQFPEDSYKNARMRFIKKLCDGKSYEQLSQLSDEDIENYLKAFKFASLPKNELRAYMETVNWMLSLDVHDDSPSTPVSQNTVSTSIAENNSSKMSSKAQSPHVQSAQAQSPEVQSAQAQSPEVQSARVQSPKVNTHTQPHQPEPTSSNNKKRPAHRRSESPSTQKPSSRKLSRTTLAAPPGMETTRARARLDEPTQYSGNMHGNATDTLDMTHISSSSPMRRSLSHSRSDSSGIDSGLSDAEAAASHEGASHMQVDQDVPSGQGGVIPETSVESNGPGLAESSERVGSQEAGKGETNSTYSDEEEASAEEDILFVSQHPVPAELLNATRTKKQVIAAATPEKVSTPAKSSRSSKTASPSKIGAAKGVPSPARPISAVQAVNLAKQSSPARAAGSVAEPPMSQAQGAQIDEESEPDSSEAESSEEENSDETAGSRSIKSDKVKPTGRMKRSFRTKRTLGPDKRFSKSSIGIFPNKRVPPVPPFPLPPWQNKPAYRNPQ